MDIIYKVHMLPCFRFRLFMQGSTDIQPHCMAIPEQDLNELSQSIPLYSTIISHFLSLKW